MIYNNYKELYNKTLQIGDILNFSIEKIYGYQVCLIIDHIYLGYHSGCYENIEIFEKLKVINPRKLAIRILGYVDFNNTTKYNTVVVKNDDFEGLTRIALFLFKECENQKIL